MEQYVAGDLRAFAELYRRAAPRLLSVVGRLTSDAARAEDIVQITFLKAHRARDSYLSGAPVLPWLSVIAKRSFYDETRPLSMRMEVLSSDGTLADADRPVAPPSSDDLAPLRRAFGQLPPQYRDAIELTKLSGMSGTEAANVLNTTKAAIKQRVHRGYAMLRNWLEPSLEPGSAATA